MTRRSVSQPIADLFPHPKIYANALAHIACMAERVASGLRPNGEAMWLPAYLYGLNLTCGRVDSVHHIIKASRKPEHPSVGADVSHVGTSAPW